MFKAQLIGKTAQVVIHTLSAASGNYGSKRHYIYNNAKILDIDTNYILLLDLEDNETSFHSGNISIDVFPNN